MTPPPLSILIVDDMQYSRMVLKNTLERLGYEDVRLAGSAARALESLEERQADVVLADWVMPQMSGLELVQAIRAMDEDRPRYTAIILFTAKEGNDPMLEAFHQGVDDYLTKPINDVQLAARVYAAGRIATLHNRLMETSAALDAANRHLEQQAMVDPITGLANLRALNQRLENVLMETQSRGGALCLAVLDLDHLEHVNARHGHDLGDEVLMGLSRRLRLCVRPTDLVARIGGDEFALLLQVHPPHHFNRDLCRRIHTGIVREGIPTSEGSIPLSVSIGARFHTHGQSLSTVHGLLSLAQDNLRQAKADGGNRVVAS
ncbi:diguanylate cyclase [Ectothiorhodospira mobilis]|uniref:diguanylate cyclase n=1 Tax=Ectothiorhodospira mobilis TaxID=195064 RepID=UPI0019087FD5|nr:diguanylate cyclase [Ectothiorhodospira mobilis]MBK1690922.1 diguanylate cyclase response regulator [Ectothiorhodospira mobilis]